MIIRYKSVCNSLFLNFYQILQGVILTIWSYFVHHLVVTSWMFNTLDIWWIPEHGPILFFYTLNFAPVIFIVRVLVYKKILAYESFCNCFFRLLEYHCKTITFVDFLWFFSRWQCKFIFLVSIGFTSERDFLRDAGTLQRLILERHHEAING